jgi:cold shock CspA family protein
MEGQNAICAIEKNNIIEMRKDVFPSIKELKSEATKYIKDGFKVSYTMKYIPKGKRDGKV